MSEHAEQTPPGARDAAASAPNAGSVNQRMAKGAAWMILARLLDRGLGLLSIVVLARLLVPEDFGLVAVASAVVALVELFGALGFDIALIQNQSTTRHHYDTAWTLNVALGTIIALLLVAVSAPAASFFAEPRLQAVIACLSLSAFIQGFENIGTVGFRKDLQFRYEFYLTIAKKFASFGITIPLAYFLRNYWALVIGSIAGRLLGLAITYWAHNYRPRPSLAAWRELLHFSKWLLATNFLHFMGTKSADLLVGKIAGAQQLGLFNLSNEISSLPTTELVAPINRAIYPGYALKANDLGDLRSSYLQVVGVIAALVVPMGVGIAALSDLLVPVVLGPKWASAVPVMFVLSFCSVLLALKSNNHYVYLALGKTQVPPLLAAVQIALILPLISIGGAREGALGVAVGLLVAQVIFTPISVATLRRVLGVRTSELWAVLHRPMIAAAIMFGGIRLAIAELHLTASTGLALPLALLFCALLGALLYAATVYALWLASARPAGAESRALAMLSSHLLPLLRRAKS